MNNWEDVGPRSGDHTCVPMLLELSGTPGGRLPGQKFPQNFGFLVCDTAEITGHRLAYRRMWLCRQRVHG